MNCRYCNYLFNEYFYISNGYFHQKLWLKYHSQFCFDENIPNCIKHRFRSFFHHNNVRIRFCESLMNCTSWNYLSNKYFHFSNGYFHQKLWLKHHSQFCFDENIPKITRIWWSGLYLFQFLWFYLFQFLWWT